jgi:hypothetical protein
METGNLIHLGAELVVQMLMLYSTSPSARRLTSEMLTGDPFNIDVKLDMKSKNRNVEILNVYLKTMGLKLTFNRKAKKFIQPMLIDPMLFHGDPHELIEPMMKIGTGEKFDLDKEVERLLRDKYGPFWGIEIEPMEYFTLDPEEYKKLTEEKKEA